MSPEGFERLRAANRRLLAAVLATDLARGP